MIEVTYNTNTDSLELKIPDELIEHLQLQDGDVLEFVLENDEVRMFKI